MAIPTQTVPLTGITGNQYAAPGYKTIYTGLPVGNQITFYIGSNADVTINRYAGTDIATGVDTVSGGHLIANIFVEGNSDEYTAVIKAGQAGQITLTHNVTGQTIVLALPKPQPGPNTNGFNVQFTDGALSFTSWVNPQTNEWKAYVSNGVDPTLTGTALIQAWNSGGGPTAAFPTFDSPINLGDFGPYGSNVKLNPQYSSEDVTDWTGGGSGATYTLTTNIDTFTGTAYDDTFNASLAGASGTSNTLNTLDSLNGNGGTDTLNVELYDGTSVTARALNLIEVVNVSVSDATKGGATLGLLNAPNLTTVNNDGSTADVTVTGIVSGADLVVTQATGDTTFTFNSKQTSADLTVTGVTAGKIDVTNATTLNLTSAGSTANVVLLGADNTSVVLDGAQDIELTAVGIKTSTLVDGTNLTGALTATLTVAGTLNGGSADDALTGGANVEARISGNDGADIITAGTGAGTSHVDSMSGGDGNDVIIFGNDLDANTSTAANNDSIDGGDGFDTLSGISADLAAIDNTAAKAIQSISNIEAITVSNALAGNLTLAKIQAGIEQVNLDAGTGANSITFDAGVDATVTISAAATGSWSVNGGSGAADSIVVEDTGTKTDVFDGKDLTLSGFETATIDAGADVLAINKIGTLTVDPTTASSSVSLVLQGAYSSTITKVASTTTGTLTIDATALAPTNPVGSAGTNFELGAVGVGTGGSIVVSGTVGNDDITTGNFKSTISGGEGNDTLTGGTSADSIIGEDGDDVINGVSGNDTLRGGAGNDDITVGAGSVSVDGGADDDTIRVGTTLTSGDTIDGGAGSNTVVVGAAVGSAAAGNRLSNLQTLEFDVGATSVTQDMSVFNNTTFTAVNTDATGTTTISNAGSGLGTIGLTGTSFTAIAESRLTDTSSDAIVVSAALAGGAATVTTLTLSDEESITLDSTDNKLTVTTLSTATDLTTLIFTGDQDSVISNAITGANATLTTITSNLTGTADVDVDASSSTVAITYTGSANTTGVDTVITGAGADIIVAGAGGINVTTNNGTDSVTGSAVDDVISTGNSIDTVYGGDGEDQITGGSSADALYGEDGDDTFVVGTTLADFATGETVSGGDGDDTLSFGDDGSITYVGRTVTSVENLVLTRGDLNVIVVTQGTGLTSVDNLEGTTGSDTNTLTLNYLNTQFDGSAQAGAADVTEAGEWFADTTADDVLTYWDETLGEAVSITFVGVGTAGSTAWTVASGNLVITVTV